MARRKKKDDGYRLPNRRPETPEELSRRLDGFCTPRPDLVPKVQRVLELRRLKLSIDWMTSDKPKGLLPLQEVELTALLDGLQLEAHREPVGIMVREDAYFGFCISRCLSCGRHRGQGPPWQRMSP